MESWVTKPIGDVITKTPTTDPRKSPNTKFQYVDVSGVSNKTLEIIEANKLLGSEAPSRARRIISEGNVIFATVRPTLRRIAVVPSSLDGQVCSTGYFVFHPKEELNNHYLFYFLQSDCFMDEMEKLQAGASYPAVNDSQIKSTLISYPSIPEQKRIVAILDQAFADIEQARAKTEQNLKNARELFESYLQQVFSRRGEGWVEVPLGSVCNFQNGYAFKSKDTVETSNTQLIRMGNLYQNVLDLNRKSVFYPDNFSDEYEQFKLNEGDMIISLTGTVGKEDYGYTVEIPATDKNLLLNQRIAKIIDINIEKIEQRFLLRILRSKVFLDKLYSTANGTRQANLSTATMKEIIITIPNTDRQRELCCEFDDLETETMKLAKIYNQKLTDLDELKKSILQKAFSGELTKTLEVDTNKGAVA
tara:strand:+ start:248 stop:1501 length:1254 start_codon:yes stop_codon:yes gene_type:complete